MFRQTSDRVRTRSFRATIIVLALIGVACAWRKLAEPRYHGRGIRSWIEQLPYDSASNSEAQEAMRHFGNAAVPYLIDAMTRSAKWENGLLAKIPKDYVSYVFDIDHYRQVRQAAIGQLEELAADEALENELQLNPKSPVFDQILPVWRREIVNDSDRIFYGLYGLAPLRTNLAPEIRPRFEKMNPDTSPEWFDLASVLAETHDPTLVPLFLRGATATNNAMAHERALRLLGRNGHSNDAVVAAVRERLQTTNAYVRCSAISACAYLNICTNEALTVIRERWQVPLEMGPNEVSSLEIYEPIIRWRINTNDTEAAASIERNLRPGSKPIRRHYTSEVLGQIGSSAKQFAPTLVEIVRTEGPPFQNDAVRALKKIAPDEARKVMAALPPRKVLHATTAKAHP